MNTDWATYLYSGGSFICRLGLKILESIFKTCDKSNKKVINEILLYGGGENEEYNKQIGLNNLLCICYVILRATRSIDVCVPELVSDTMARRIITAHQKNKLKVRIIIHKSKKFHNLKLFAQNGIEVKMISPVIPLEYEFLLIDTSSGGYKDAIAVMGCLDYDTASVNCNHGSTIITSETVVVKAFKTEFDRVWNLRQVM